jgi:hypothetical protein
MNEQYGIFQLQRKVNNFAPSKCTLLTSIDETHQDHSDVVPKVEREIVRFGGLEHFFIV